MAAPTPERTITGRPVPRAYNDYIFNHFGDTGGASNAHFYVWSGIAITSVNDSNIDNWWIGVMPSWCITIGHPAWGSSPGSIRGDLTGGYHVRGGISTWDWNGNQIKYQNLIWYYSGSFTLQYASEGDHELWRGASSSSQMVEYKASPGETIQLWATTGSYSAAGGGSYNSSTLPYETTCALKLPCAPFCYFHWNDPRDSSVSDYHGDGYNSGNPSTNSSVVYSRARSWQGTNYTFPSDPVIAQYNFLGWYDQATGGNKVTSLQAQVDTNHLYAHWELAGHNIYFDGDDNTGGQMEHNPDIKPIGIDYTIPACSFTKNDYTFQYWAGHRADPNTNMNYDPGDTYSIDQDLWLKAVWKRNHHPARANGLPIVKRCDSSGADSDVGTYISVSAPFIFDKLWVDYVKVKIYYKNAQGTWVQVAGGEDTYHYTGEITDAEGNGTISFNHIPTSGSALFDIDKSYSIKIEFLDKEIGADNYAIASSVETFLSSAFFYMDINPETKVTAFGAGAGQTAVAWDDSGSGVIDQSHTAGTVDFHTNTLFSNDVYFHEGSQLLLGGQAGNSGDVLASNGTGAAPVWRSPINISVETLYSKPSSWWMTSVLGGKEYWDYGELNEDIIDLNGDPIYQFIIVCWTAGTSSDMTNVRGELVVPVSRIHQWNTYDSETGNSDIMSGTNSHELVYMYPASSPSWYIDIAFGFLNSHHIYATKRTGSNFTYWNICEIIGIKIDGWGQGSAPLGYTRFTGPLSYTPSASQSVNIDTDGTYIDDDITVNQIPYVEVGNEAGGRTATIAS